MTWRLAFLRLTALALLAAVAPGGLGAAEVTLGSASVAARWLDLPLAARLSAMGGAYAGVADDVNSVAVNPAGLGSVTKGQALFTHNVLREGASRDQLLGALPVGGLGGLGVGLDYVSFGQVDRYAVSPGGALVPMGAYNPYGATLSLAWGHPLAGGVSAGVGAKLILQSLNLDLASAEAVDLGLLWRTPWSGLSAGASVENLGSKLLGSDLPLHARAGLAYSVSSALRLAFDGVLSPRDSSLPVGLAGAEYQAGEHVCLRGGYQIGGADDPSGFTVGAGLSGLGPLAIDYAYNAVGALGATQQVSLRVDFGGQAALAPEQPVAAAAPQTALEKQVSDFVQQLKKKDYPGATRQGQSLALAAPEAAKQASLQTQDEVVRPAVFEGRYEEVTRALVAMQGLDPKDAYVEEALGMMDWHQGRFETARAHYRKAADLDPRLEYLVRWSRESGPQP